MNGNCQAGMSARKFIAAALALSFFMLSADVYGKQKKGATVIITLKDGQPAGSSSPSNQSRCSSWTPLGKTLPST